MEYRDNPVPDEVSTVHGEAPKPNLYQPSKFMDRSRSGQMLKNVAAVLLAGGIMYLSFRVLLNQALVLTSSPPCPDVAGHEHAADAGAGAVMKHSDMPDYFQTNPGPWTGPTKTGAAPFLAQTNAVSFAPTATFVPNEPLETAIPIVGQMRGNESVFRLMGHLSPYFPNPIGFGVAEYPLPKGAKIAQVQMLSRHGSRYPTLGSNVQVLAENIAKAMDNGSFKGSGSLDFLNDWKYALGHEILVPKGRQELYDSGILHYYEYAQLYNPFSKIIARTTTQDRMLKSSEYFLAGFFGLEWANNATIEVIIESAGFNNSLAGYDNCKNAFNYRSQGGANATNEWVDIYLLNATSRFQSLTEGFHWTPRLVYAAQTMCPYETVAYGYSAFCNLFTYQEWVNFEYSVDLQFAGGSSFQSPTGRAVGLGYVQEVVARLENHTLGYSGSQLNWTLDSSEETFPLNQSLYFDFSHDTNIMSILTAFGLTQFNEFLPATSHPGKHNLTVSHMEPFGARLDIEIIKTPRPLADDRTYIDGSETTYVHFILNQRTLPLGISFEECGERKDGWCELEAFLKRVRSEIEKVDYDWACNGEYPVTKYGVITDGMPIDKRGGT